MITECQSNRMEKVLCSSSWTFFPFLSFLSWFCNNGCIDMNVSFSFNIQEDFVFLVWYILIIINIFWYCLERKFIFYLSKVPGVIFGLCSFVQYSTRYTVHRPVPRQVIISYIQAGTVPFPSHFNFPSDAMFETGYGSRHVEYLVPVLGWSIIFYRRTPLTRLHDTQGWQVASKQTFSITLSLDHTGKQQQPYPYPNPNESTCMQLERE